MTSVFSDHVRSLRGDTPPDDHEIEEVRHALRRLLFREMRRRGLDQLEPSWLGVHGWRQWIVPGAGDEDDALDELTAECYLFIFVQRGRSLGAQLDDKPTIDGLITLNVRHFLFERQKRHDPLGYRSYEVVHRAVRDALDAERLFRIIDPAGDAAAGPTKPNERMSRDDMLVRNNTVLATTVESADQGSETTDLTVTVADWPSDLMPEIFDTGGPQTIGRLAERLAPRIDHLAGQDIERFRFKTLVDPIKKAIRGAWASLLDDEIGATAIEIDADGQPTAVRVVEPDTTLEAQNQITNLDRAVHARIDATDLPEPRRRELHDLWRLVRTHLDDDRGAGRGRADDGGIALPSHRQISGSLGIHRRRVPDLFAHLRDVVRQARASLGHRDLT
ncbi:MAG: hypothetical protein AAGD38_21210 [Acidobacteriota bacterium]